MNESVISFYAVQSNNPIVNNVQSLMKNNVAFNGIMYLERDELDSYQLLGYFAVSREHFSENTLEILELAKNVLLREFKLKSLDRV